MLVVLLKVDRWHWLLENRIHTCKNSASVAVEILSKIRLSLKGMVVFTAKLYHKSKTVAVEFQKLFIFFSSWSCLHSFCKPLTDERLWLNKMLQQHVIVFDDNAAATVYWLPSVIQHFYGQYQVTYVTHVVELGPEFESTGFKVTRRRRRCRRHAGRRHLARRLISSVFCGSSHHTTAFGSCYLIKLDTFSINFARHFAAI